MHMTKSSGTVAPQINKMSTPINTILSHLDSEAVTRSVHIPGCVEGPNQFNLGIVHRFPVCGGEGLVYGNELV